MADGHPLTDPTVDEWLERRFPDPLPLEDRVAAGRTRARRRGWALVVVVPSVLAGVVWAAFAVDAAFPMDPQPSEPPEWANSLGGVMLVLGFVSAVMGLVGFSERLQAPEKWLPRAFFALTWSQWSELSREMAGRNPVVPGDEIILDDCAQRVTKETPGAWLALVVCLLLSLDSVFEWRPTPLKWVLLILPAGLALTLWHRQWIARGYLRRRRVAAVLRVG